VVIIYDDITSLKTSARTCNTDTNASDNNNITTISDVEDGIEIEKRALVRNDSNICARPRECEPVGQVAAKALMAVDRGERERERVSGLDGASERV